MPNYDFHSCFSPPEFERFVRDVLEIRESRKFENYGIGKDGGIDLRTTDGGETIICQVKCFQKNFPQLLSVLRRSEVTKARKLAPQRYIVATSLSLLPQQKDKIRAVFGPLIRDNADILSRDDLNALLGKPEYHEVERRHYKLWLTSSNVFLSLLAAELRRGEYNETREQMEKMRNQLPRYVQNRTFPEALSILEKRRFVLITGPPGIGKTMLGHALAMHFIEQHHFEFVFVRSSVKEARSQYYPERRQIFFMDDFWGSVFERDPSNRNEERSLLSFLEKIEHDPNKALILTSREYVFQRGSQRQNYAELGRFLSRSKCMVTHEAFSEMDRAKILYNHLYFSGLSPYCIEDLVNGDRFLRVIQHRNYTPRAIEQFIDRESSANDSRTRGFADGFLKYLDDPFEYWIEAVEKQNDTARLILFILAISNPPMMRSALFDTLKAAVTHAALFGITIDVTRADESLKELDRTFVLTTRERYDNDLRVNFQNPSLTDVMLRYLNSKMDSWGEILLKSARFFSQLDFAFTTDEEEYCGDGYLEYGLDSAGKKIKLGQKHAAIVRERMLSDLENLGFTAVDPDLDRQYSQYSSSKETLVPKLIRLSQLFDLNQHSDVRAFLCDHFRCVEEDLFADEQQGLAKAALNDIPRLVKTVKPFLQMNGDLLVERFYDQTTFVTELLSWAEFEEIFPSEYRSFVQRKLPDIRRHVRHLIVWDAEWYYEEGEDFKLDMLFEWQIDEVLKLFGMRKTKSLMKMAEEAAGRFHEEVDEVPEKLERSEPATPEEKEEPFDEKRVRDEFSSLVAEPESNYIEDDEIEEFVRLHITDDQKRGKVLKTFGAKKYANIANDRLILSLLCKHYSSADQHQVDALSMLSRLTEAELLSNLGKYDAAIQRDDLMAIFQTVCFEYYFGDSESFLDALAAIHQSNISKLSSLSIDEFHEILVPFFNFGAQDLAIASEQVGRRFACKHLCNLTSDERMAFYCDTFSRFSDETCAIDWWDDFLRCDRQTFIRSFVAPVGESVIAAITDASSGQRFLAFLKLIELGFDMVLGIPERQQELSVTTKAGRKMDLLEYVAAGLCAMDVGEFLMNTLTDSQAESLASERILFKDHIPDAFPEHPDARMVRIDFGKLIPTIDTCRIVQEMGEAFSFASKFEQLCHEFAGLLGE